MTRINYFAIAALLAGTAVPALAADPPNPQQGGWFVPPPSNRSGTVVDTSVKDSIETVTVIARRPTRSWRTHVGDDTNNPLASNSAHPLSPAKPYCNATLRTVGGQPSNTAEMMSGIGSGGCD